MASTALLVDDDTRDRSPTRRFAEPGSAFASVLCGVDMSANAQAARKQAELLASPGGTVEFVNASQLTRHGSRVLPDDYDLLVIGAGAATFAALDDARIPILSARHGPIGTAVTDSILVPVGDPHASRAAIELAAQLAAQHDGTVTILAAPPRNAALERAIAAGRRTVLQATGAVPHVIGEWQSPKRSIPEAAAALPASLVILGAGRTHDREMAVSMAGAIPASVLVLPSQAQTQH
jgi:nucleotide-binding universal stress UspA family protein